MGIEVIARDWDRPDWRGPFYPDDLPEDWRLTYFANGFESVLVPAARWRSVQPARLAQWAKDVPARFRFYLELDGGLAPGTARAMELNQAAAALGDRYAGRVERPPPPAPGGPVIGSGTDLEGWLAAYDGEGHALLARGIPQAITADLQAAVAWLRSLAAEVGPKSALAVLDEGPPQALTRWCQLVLLAGLA
jgi:hypothetical protein